MEYDLYINDTIGWPISAGYVRAQLAKCKGKPCDVYISSLGGDVATALQIRQLFVEHGDVRAHLHGFVASAATIVATGCKSVRMGKFALFMIHKCSAWQEQWGRMNADDIAAAIDKLTNAKNALESIDHVIGSIYAQRTGKPMAELAEMMRAETWLTAAEAKEQGFVDEVIGDEQPAALTDDLRQRILACGYPLPKTQEKQPSLWQRMEAFLEEHMEEHARRTAQSALADHSDPSNTINNHQNNQNPMNKDHKAIMALLLVEALAVTSDGEFTLTAEQMKTIDEHLAQLAADKQVAEDALATAQQQVATLAAQVEALKKADGDDTPHVEGDSEEAENHTAAARANYEKLKAVL